MVQIQLAARGGITTYFREDIGRGFPHNGIDQGHGNGNAVDLEIWAPADGWVTFAGPMGTYGNVIFIRHDDGWISVLAHHAKQHVRAGQRVTRGNVIAVMGNTGTIFVHNHQELRDADGNQVDPLLNLSSAPASTITEEIEDMPLTEAEWKRIDLANEGANLTLLARIPAAVWAANLQFKAAERNFDGTASEWLLNMSNAVGAILRKPSAVVDPAKLADELAKAGIVATVDTAALARALDASLSDNFAAIPGATVSALKTAL